MQINYYKEYSPSLGRDMEFKSYGWAGKPILYIPCQDGRFYDFENFGMDNVLAGRIEAGQVQAGGERDGGKQKRRHQGAHHASLALGAYHLRTLLLSTDQPIVAQSRRSPI